MAEIANNITPWPEETMKQYAWLDAYLLKQPATQKEFQPAWQAYKYLLSGKMYAYMGVQDQVARPILTIKLEPSFSELLRSSYEDIIPGYYMNKLHWSTVYLDGAVPKEVLTDIVQASYHVVFSALSKKVQQELSGKSE